MKDNVEEITVSNELADYIRGEKRFANNRPDMDYTRWFIVANCLKNSESVEVKKQITETLLLLLDSPKWQDIYAVAGICLNIESPEIDKKIENRILQPDFISLPDALVSFLSKYVLKKKLHFVANKVVENSIKKNHIKWVVTLVSPNLSEQEDYWTYCDKIFSDVLLTMSHNEEIQVQEKVTREKDSTMKLFFQMSSNK